MLSARASIQDLEQVLGSLFLAVLLFYDCRDDEANKKCVVRVCEGLPDLFQHRNQLGIIESRVSTAELGRKERSVLESFATPYLSLND